MTSMTPIDTNSATPVDPINGTYLPATADAYLFRPHNGDASGSTQMVGGGFPIHSVQINGAPWFVAADVCKALGLNINSSGHPNVTMACQKLDQDETAFIRIESTSRGGITQKTRKKVVSESGLYKLISRSDKPQAKKFQNWVTRDVLPAIRKTGSYVKGEENFDLTTPEGLAAALSSVFEASAVKIAALQKEHDALKAQIEILKPKADAYDSFLNTEDLFAFTEAARLLGFRTPQALTRRLEQARFIYPYRSKKTGHVITWCSYQEHHDSGLFSARYNPANSKQPFSSLKITPKGIAYFKKFFDTNAE